MPERDARAVDIQPLEVGGTEAPAPGTGQHLGGEGLVEVDEVHVIQRKVGSSQRGCGRWDWPDTHGARGDAGNGPRHEASQWAKAEIFRSLPMSHDADGGTVV